MCDSLRLQELKAETTLLNAVFDGSVELDLFAEAGMVLEEDENVIVKRNAALCVCCLPLMFHESVSLTCTV